MTVEEAYGYYCEVEDFEAVKGVFERCPEIFSHILFISDVLHTCAKREGPGATDFIAYLLSRGVDVNLKDGMEYAIDGAANLNRTETVRLLLQHHSEVNTRTNSNNPVCLPLNAAIQYRNIEMAHLLVDAGASLNFLDFTNRTPLTWAIICGCEEIANYIRLKGGKEAWEVPGYIPLEAKKPL